MGDRISRSVMLMEMAHIVAKRGTCSRLQVGAVISKEGRILTMGYNGAPSGLPHCVHEDVQPIGYIMPDPRPEPDEHGVRQFEIRPGRVMVMPDDNGQITTMGCQIAEHAERNAIAWAARNGVALEGSELHCTHAPCLDCARSIINSGIKTVTYKVPYRLTAGVELLRHAGIQVIDARPWV